jgi:hypothetical protein
MAILGAAGAAYFLNRQRRVQGVNLETLDEKAQHYRFSVIVRSAILEGANLLAIIAAMMDLNMTYLLYFIVGLLAFLFFRPSINEFCKAYDVEKSRIE